MCILANNPFLERDCFLKLIPFHRDATFVGLSHFLSTPKCRIFGQSVLLIGQHQLDHSPGFHRVCYSAMVTVVISLVSIHREFCT